MNVDWSKQIANDAYSSSSHVVFVLHVLIIICRCAGVSLKIITFHVKLAEFPRIIEFL